MKNEYEVINVTIFEPKDHPFKSERNKKAYCSTVSCNNTENCDLYKTGQCMRLSMFAELCPYGKNKREEGFTKNAKAYQSWINNIKEKYKNVLYKLHNNCNIMTNVGDYVYLPYSHIDINKNVPFLKHNLYFINGIKIIKKEDWNLQTVLNIITFKPQAMMGGEITSYQKQIIPLFIKHLSEKYPELYKALIKTRPEYETMIENYSYIGRKAYLNTVKIGSVFTHHKGATYEEKWTWDGTYLNYTGNKLSFAITDFQEVVIKLTPKENSTIIIEDNEQVTKNTKFTN